MSLCIVMIRHSKCSPIQGVDSSRFPELSRWSLRSLGCPAHISEEELKILRTSPIAALLEHECPHGAIEGWWTISPLPLNLRGKSGENAIKALFIQKTCDPSELDDLLKECKEQGHAQAESTSHPTSGGAFALE